MVKIKLYNIKAKKTFYKYFDTEYDRDKFISKLRYSKNLKIVKDYIDTWCN